MQVSYLYNFICSKLLFSVESILNRVRRNTTPSMPASSDFDISDFYRQTLNGLPFICTDRFIRNKRMILFPSAKQLKTLFTSEWIFLDGTFDSCPAQFSQLYTIRGLKFRQNQSTDYVLFVLFSFDLDLPCIISLLSSKSTDTYVQLFSEPEWHVERLDLKFEP